MSFIRKSDEEAKKRATTGFIRKPTKTNNSTVVEEQTVEETKISASDGNLSMQSPAQTKHKAEVTPLTMDRLGLPQVEDDDDLLGQPTLSERKTLDSLLVEGDANSNASPRRTSPRGASPRLASPMTGRSTVSRSGKKSNKNNQSVRASVTSLSASFNASPGKQQDNVKVVIRVRPVNEREKAGGPASKVDLCMQVERNEEIILDRGMHNKTFTFDFVATQDSEQHELFGKIAQPIADACLQGYNGTIFAYGQTGSGKTFTIQGPTQMIKGEETLIGANNSDEKLYEKRGLMQRSFEYMFDVMEQQKREGAKNGIEMQFLVKSSYLEIYNEQIMDLLDTQSFNLHVREDIKKGVYVEGLIEETVSNVNEMMNLTSRGARNRHVGSTLMNKESSRSHSVLTTTIESKTMNEEGNWQMKSSRFHIIDLAGSERSKNTQAQGDRLKEAGMINKSLTALGIVINSLVEISKGKNMHVHYRDSKLTFLLRDSLGGNSKTVIIANVTAASISVGETLSTLQFAERAKKIKNKAVINEESSSTIHLLKQELRRTKKDLAESTNQLKIAHQQIKILDKNGGVIPGVETDKTADNSQNNETICKICKRDVSNEDDFGMEFQDFQNSTGASMAIASAQEINVADFASNNSQRNNNQNAFKRSAEFQAMRDRVGKVEKLLSENLENTDIQQKQYEQQIDTLTQSNKDKQDALVAQEKNIARDKMIVKFREERITDLEAKLAQAEEGSSTSCSDTNCENCISLRTQLDNAKKEIEQWLEVADKNPQVAKLHAEKEELIATNLALQSELKVTPESLTARIRGLNELTNNLNAYLKEYCLNEGFDRLKEELENSNEQMIAQLATLQADLSDKELSHSEKIRTLNEDHEVKITALNSKIDQMKETFETEKIKIEQVARDQMTQLKENLDASLAEKGQLQQDILDKVAAHEKQTELQKIIDQQSKSLEELNAEKQALVSQVSSERTEKDNLAKLQRQTQTNMQETTQQLQDQIEKYKHMLNQQLREAQQKSNQDIQDREKEIATIKEENRMQEESCADLERKLRKIQGENDRLEEQVLETNEEIQEKRRHVKEIEVKLNSTIRDTANKADQLQEVERSLRSELQSNINQLNEVKTKEEEKSRQLAEVTTQYEVLKAESSAKIEGLQSSVTMLSNQNHQVTAMVSDQTSRLTQLEQKEKSLQGIVTLSETKVEELARYEVEHQLMKKKIEVFEQEIASMTVKLSQTRSEKALKAEEYEEVKVQVSAMEELTVSLTNQAKDKEIEISTLRASITEKDLQIASTLKDFDEGNKQLKHSLADEQKNVDMLKREITGLKAMMVSKHQEQELQKQQLQDQLNKVQANHKKDQEKIKQETKKAEQAESQVLKIMEAQERMIEEVKQEFQKETQKNKFSLELDYQTKVQNKETELRESFNTNQSQDAALVRDQQQEIQKLQMDLQRQKQARQMALMSIQGQVKLIKQEYQEFVNSVSKELVFKRVAPKMQFTKDFVDQVKQVSVQLATIKQYRQDNVELKQRLSESQVLVRQLQEEKRSINSKLEENLSYVETAKAENTEIIDTLSSYLQAKTDDLANAKQLLNQQKTQAEDYVKKLKQQHTEQFQKATEENREYMQSLQDEADQIRQHRSEAQNELSQYKSATSEQRAMLTNSKEVIASMVTKDNQFKENFEKKVVELGAQIEQYKARDQQKKQEKEAILSKYETLKKDNQNLRDLIKIKDEQIENHRRYDLEWRQERDRLQEEIRQKTQIVQKRENDIKQVVDTLQSQSQEKKRLESELVRMRSQNSQQPSQMTQPQVIGGSNQAQIQQVLKLKEENNKLKEELVTLQEQVRRMMSSSGVVSSEHERQKKELKGLQDQSARLAETLLRQPGIAKFVSTNQQLANYFKKNPMPEAYANTISDLTYYANQKIVGTGEVLIQICAQLVARVQQSNQLSKDLQMLQQQKQ